MNLHAYFKPTPKAIWLGLLAALIVGFTIQTFATSGWPGMFKNSDLTIGKGPDVPVERFACLTRNWKVPCTGEEFATQQIRGLLLFVVFDPFAWLAGCLVFLSVAWFEAKKK